MTDRLKVVEGLALYLRAYRKDVHGSMDELAERYAEHGAKWVAIAGMWQYADREKFINTPEECRALAKAFEAQDVTPFVWGYPWQGKEAQFAEAQARCAEGHMRLLIDPELGSNPTRSSTGDGKKRANDHAEMLVRHIEQRGFDVCGLSTYGDGVRMRWFPLYAFTRALSIAFPKRTFIGGQTYTDDKKVDRGIADFLRVVQMFGGLERVQLVPNFGTYTWKYEDGERRARSKTPVEMDAHFMEFIDEGEPVHAMIGWADNFMTPELWDSFGRMAARMERGACRL